MEVKEEIESKQQVGNKKCCYWLKTVSVDLVLDKSPVGFDVVNKNGRINHCLEYTAYYVSEKNTIDSIFLKIETINI